jgi:ABC-type antimicrobial peptide transport system permease subunit
VNLFWLARKTLRRAWLWVLPGVLASAALAGGAFWGLEVVSDLAGQTGALLSIVLAVAGLALWVFAGLLAEKQDGSFSLLRTLGARRSDILVLVLLEMITVSFVGSAAGVAVSASLVVPSQSGTARLFSLAARGAVVVFSTVAASALLSLPIAARVCRRSPYEAIRSRT